MQYSATTSRLALAALIVLGAARPATADQIVNLLPNGGAERVDSLNGEAAEWSTATQPAKGLKIWRDTEHPRQGEACFAIVNEHDYETLVANNWMHELRFAPRGRVIRVRGEIRTKDAEAANICVQCWGPGGENLVGFASTPVLRGTKEWTSVESERIVIPRDTTKVVVRAALTGKGSVWFDDLKLEVVGPPVVSDPGLSSAVPGRIVRRLPLEKDSMILAYLPEWSHGNVDNIAVADNDGGVRTLVKWETPTAADVDPAGHRFLLALYCRNGRSKSETASLLAHTISEDWPEILKWTQCPKFSDEPAITGELRRGSGWRLLDVTPVVRGAAASERDFKGIVLRMDKEDCESNTSSEPKKQPCSDFSFVSREGIGEWENRRPVLLVVDPDQPPVDEPIVSKPSPRAQPMSSDEFVEYMEYLASLPESSVQPVPGAKDAEFAAAEATGKASAEKAGTYGGPHEEWVETSLIQLAAEEPFVASYPLSPEGVLRLSILSSLYFRSEQVDKAERSARAATQLARGSEMECITEINRASIEQKIGNIEAAEARLRRVMAMKLPATKDRRTWDILFVAPQILGDQLYERKAYEAAEEVYVKLIEAVVKWNAEHPEDKKVASSYALWAQRGRVNMVLDKNLDDDAGVNRLVEEFGKLVPGPVDLFGAGAETVLRENVESRRRMRDRERAAGSR